MHHGLSKMIPPPVYGFLQPFQSHSLSLPWQHSFHVPTVQIFTLSKSLVKHVGPKIFSVASQKEFKKSLNILGTATLSAKPAQTYLHPLSSSSVLHPQWKGYFSFYWHPMSSCLSRTSRREPPSILSIQHFHHPWVFALFADKQMQVSLSWYPSQKPNSQHWLFYFHI